MHILDAHATVAAAGDGSPFALRFSVAADVAPKGATHLVVEAPERFVIIINGQEIGNNDTGWWVDPSFRKLELGSKIQAGRNEIELRGIFARGSELESVYLLGNFGVAARKLKEESRVGNQIFDRYAPEFRLSTALEHAKVFTQPAGPGLDLTQQGMPFFAGRVTLRQELAIAAKPKQACLVIDRLCAALAHVRINGNDMGVIAWQPHQIDITHGLRVGRNTVEIELVGTLRNLLGPHHLSGGEQGWTEPSDFRDQRRWTDDYILVPFGLGGVTVKLLDG